MGVVNVRGSNYNGSFIKYRVCVVFLRFNSFFVVFSFLVREVRKICELEKEKIF